MKKTCTDNDVAAWQEITLSHRQNLDLATLFWFWSKIERDFELVKTFNLILKFFDVNDITHIPPRQLWGDLLGESESEQLKRDFLRKPNSMYERDILGSVKYIEPPRDEHILLRPLQGHYRIRSKCNTFDIDKWDLIIQTTNPPISEIEQYTPIWFLQYRQAICKVTPFSDYFVTKRIPGKSQEATKAFDDNAHGRISNNDCDMILDGLDLFIEENDYRLLFFEELVIDKEEDIYSTGLASRIDTFNRLESMCVDNPSSEGIFHPILGNPFYTHSFINLDSLINKADEAGFSIPAEFRKLKDCDTPIEQDGMQDTINIEIDFDSHEQFPLLKLAPLIIAYLSNDPECQKLLLSKSNNGHIKEILVTKINLSLKKANVKLRKPEITITEVEHIWQIIALPTTTSSANKTKNSFQKDLIKVRDKFWQGTPSIVTMKAPDKIAELTDENNGDKYNRKVAKAFIALLSPEANKTSGKLSDEKLLEFRKQIMDIDLDWTENTFFYSG